MSIRWDRIEAIIAITAVIASLVGVGIQVRSDNHRQKVLSSIDFCQNFTLNDTVDELTQYTSGVYSAFSVVYKEAGFGNRGMSIDDVRSLRKRIESENTYDGKFYVPNANGEKILPIVERNFNLVNNLLAGAMLAVDNGAFDQKTLMSCLGRTLICWRERYSIRLPIYAESDPDMLKIRQFVESLDVDVENYCPIATLSEWSPDKTDQ
jgi:hypothetical protein